ncbi:MAG: hypothetical protein GWO86_01155 [Planctomycetes bacterium]|nr:hypothetical protein [Planctomycetota bacterium]
MQKSEEQLAGRSVTSETIPIAQALGRIAIEDQKSLLDIPSFDKSAMDGYAVRNGDQREDYRLLETVPAGAVPAIELTPGTCTKVMTGAPVPRSSGRVIMVEHTAETDRIVHVLRNSEARNICHKAERMAYLPCRLTSDGLLKPVSYHGSAHLQALRDSDGFFIVPKGVTEISAGQKVDFLILRGSFQ